MFDINLSTALSTAVVAVFSGITLILLIRQRDESKPVVTSVDNGGDSSREHQNILFTISPPYDEKYILRKIKIIHPKSAEILNPNDKKNNVWSRQLSIGPNRSFVSLRIRGARGLKVNSSISLELRSIFKRKIITHATNIMND